MSSDELDFIDESQSERSIERLTDSRTIEPLLRMYTTIVSMYMQVRVLAGRSTRYYYSVQVHSILAITLLRTHCSPIYLAFGRSVSYRGHRAV